MKIKHLHFGGNRKKVIKPPLLPYKGIRKEENVNSGNSLPAEKQNTARFLIPLT